MRKNTNTKQTPSKPVVPQRIVPRGKAIERTDAEIDDMTSAEAMEALVEDAANDWKDNAPKAFKTLLDAE